MIPLVASESTDSVRRFEDAIAAHHGAAGAVATNSGTSALHLALLALGVGPESVVACPSYCCVAVLNAIRLTGAKVELLDNDFKPEQMQFNLSQDAIHEATLKHSRTGHLVLIAPFMFGVSPKAWCERYDAVIEDRAMALGNEKPIRGDCAVHSFHVSKIISTGEGGMVVARTPELLARLRDLNGYADAVVADRLNPEPEYVPRANLRMPESAAKDMAWMVDVGLKVRLWKRTEIAAHYIDRLGLNITLPAGSIFGRFVFPVPVTHGPNPPDFVRRMAARGVEAGRGVAPPLHVYLKMDGKNFPNAEKAFSRLVSLPLYPALTNSQVEQVTDAAKAVLGR